MEDITKVVDQIIKELDAEHYPKADRLHKVLEQLVKVKVAQVEAGKL